MRTGTTLAVGDTRPPVAYMEHETVSYFGDNIQAKVRAKKTDSNRRKPCDTHYGVARPLLASR
jgi:hypothetical protein